jgi:transcriptional regulator with XRE-family HTH domain
MARPNSRDPGEDPAAALGEQLKRLREEAGFSTQQALAARLARSADVVTKAETGAQPPSNDVFDSWMDACRVPESERTTLRSMLTIARKFRGPIPQFIHRYLEEEEKAEFLRLWSIVLVPGLLQVEEYALAMYDLPGIDQEEAAATVGVYMDRQSIIEGPDAAQVIAIVDESVLYRRIGTAQAMVRQLDHLLEMAQRPNVTIQVAQGVASYWGLVGSFNIASREGAADTLLMRAVEDQTVQDRTLTRKALILFEKIRGHALNVGDSRAVIMEARRHWESQQ